MRSEASLYFVRRPGIAHDRWINFGTGNHQRVIAGFFAPVAGANPIGITMYGSVVPMRRVKLLQRIDFQPQLRPRFAQFRVCDPQSSISPPHSSLHPIEARLRRGQIGIGRFRFFSPKWKLVVALKFAGTPILIGNRSESEPSASTSIWPAREQLCDASADVEAGARSGNSKSCDGREVDRDGRVFAPNVFIFAS